MRRKGILENNSYERWSPYEAAVSLMNKGMQRFWGATTPTLLRI